MALRAAGVPVRIIERAPVPGGRMASPHLNGRPVDIGAGYFTVRDDEFAAIVRRWADAGLARPWTDTFGVLSPGQPATTSSGPVRWATPDGLRSLVENLLTDIDVQVATDADALPAGEVVLAMPDPQAAALTQVPDAVEYQPVIAVVCAFAERSWSFGPAAFVNDHPDIEFIVDDGDRRGDGAPVLVVHTTAARAARHLDDPVSAVAPVVAALRELVGVPQPTWTQAHRWRYAKPAGQHSSTYGRTLDEHRQLGFAGDQWCPSGAPRIESAWRSGTDLGRAIAADRHPAT
jgi:hypothetical protein